MSLEVGGVVELGAVGAAWVERGAEKEGVAAAETDDAAGPAWQVAELVLLLVVAELSELAGDARLRRVLAEEAAGVDRGAFDPG